MRCHQDCGLANKLNNWSVTNKVRTATKPYGRTKLEQEANVGQKYS